MYPKFSLGTARFANPTLFRHPDGTLRHGRDRQCGEREHLRLPLSDLVTFSDQNWVLTNTQGIVVSRADVAYDNGIGSTASCCAPPAGLAYEVTTADFTAFSAPVAITAPAVPVTGLPSGAIEASALPSPQSELALLQKSLGRIVNTTVDAGDDIEVEVGGELACPRRSTWATPTARRSSSAWTGTPARST